jgi:polyhydroxyalkanoate synthase
VLLVPSIINRYYILDLRPGRSLVEYLVGRGFDVFLIDWGSPGPEERGVTFDEHIEGYLGRAVEAASRLSGAGRVTLLGYCLGGVMTAAFAALRGERVKNLVQLAAPISFRDDGMLRLWARKENFPVDLLIDAYGDMPAWLLQLSFKWLRPTTPAKNALALWDKLLSPEKLEDFLALSRWVEDNVSVPGETYRKFVKDCYQEDLLAKNRLLISGRAVDLGRIECPLLNVVAQDDHICPPSAGAILNELAQSRDAELLTVSGGHIGAIVGAPAKAGLWPRLAEWLAARS